MPVTFKAGKGVLSALVASNLETGRKEKKKSVWFTWFTGPSWSENEGKDEYVTCLVTGNGCLPYKVVIVMLTTLPGVGSRGYWS